MRRHVKVLAWMYILHGAILLLAGFGMLLVMSVASSYFERADPGGEATMVTTSMYSLLGRGLAFISAIVGIPRLVCGFGLMKFRPWARTLTLLIATLGMIDFPVGTGTSAYAYWILMSKEGGELFRPS